MRLRIRDGSIESEIGTLAIGRRGILLVAEWLVGKDEPPAFDESDAAAERLAAAYARYFRGNLQAFDRLGMGEQPGRARPVRRPALASRRRGRRQLAHRAFRHIALRGRIRLA